jgi:hypothetical protein
VAVDIESTAWKLGAGIGPGEKVQKLLDAMHPILKRAVKPQIKREDQIDPERAAPEYQAPSQLSSVTGPYIQGPRTTDSSLITKSNFRLELGSQSRIQ